MPGLPGPVLYRLWKRLLVCFYLLLQSLELNTQAGSAKCEYNVSLYVLGRGEDYKNHIKCISEDQKYGGKGYEAKANKGDVKQQQWIQVNSAHQCNCSVCLKQETCCFVCC